MASNGFIIVTLMLLIFADSLSNASIVLNFGKVIRLKSVPSATTQKSPLPSPVNGSKDLNSSTVDAGNPVKEKPKDPEVINNKTTGAANQPNRKQRDKGQSHEGKDKVGGTKDSQLVSNESCEGLPKSCNIQNTMVACIQNSGGSKQLVILVQNKAERTLKVHIANLTTVDNALQAFEIPFHQTKKINILVADVKTNKIVLNTENGNCVIHTAPASGKNFFKQLSFYSKQVTPIYGVYFVFLVALVFGGIWACCKFRKSKWQGGVPYQELEMGLPESAAAAAAAAAAVNLDSTEGWDQDWDDDWDDDRAVKPPGGHHVGSISANGLTSRSSKRDGWEVDWEN